MTFDGAIKSILKDYNRQVDKILREESLAIAKDARNQVRANIKSSGIKGKKYKGSISRKALTRNKNGAIGQVIYAKDPHYRLTHLLEYGHATVNGGRTRAFPHFKAANDEAVAKFEENVTRRIEEIDAPALGDRAQLIPLGK